jgi:hypothetical protein
MIGRNHADPGGFDSKMPRSPLLLQPRSHAMSNDPTKAAIDAMCAETDEDRAAFNCPKRAWRAIMTTAFHGLNGVVRVVPIEATEEMVHAANRRVMRNNHEYIAAATGAGDLTKRLP